jgi:hypothetical protein
MDRAARRWRAGTEESDDGCGAPESDSTPAARWTHPQRGGDPYPSLLARITDAASGQPLSLHFTHLKADGVRPGIKTVIVRCAARGAIPAGFATWLIQRGGLKDA